jgi:hypothetical protein
VLEPQESLEHLQGIKITPKKRVAKVKRSESFMTIIKDGVTIDSEEFIDGRD